MSGYRQYVTPAQSAIYIGPYHVDDAYAVEWEHKDSNSPIYTYYKKNYVNTSLGKQIVVGSLAINFRYPGYLAYAVANARKAAAQGSSLAIQEFDKHSKASVNEYLDKMRIGTADERLKLLIEAAADSEARLEVVSALAYLSGTAAATQLEGKGNTPFSEVFDVQNPWDVEVMPIDVWIHYGDLDEIHVADIIRGVMFTGKGKQIQAGVLTGGGLSASGNNLMELYSFYASEVNQVLIDPGQVTKAVT